MSEIFENYSDYDWSVVNKSEDYDNIRNRIIKDYRRMVYWNPPGSSGSPSESVIQYRKIKVDGVVITDISVLLEYILMDITFRIEHPSNSSSRDHGVAVITNKYVIEYTIDMRFNVITRPFKVYDLCKYTDCLPKSFIKTIAPFYMRDNPSTDLIIPLKGTRTMSENDVRVSNYISRELKVSLSNFINARRFPPDEVISHVFNIITTTETTTHDDEDNDDEDNDDDDNDDSDNYSDEDDGSDEDPIELDNSYPSEVESDESDSELSYRYRHTQANAGAGADYDDEDPEELEYKSDKRKSLRRYGGFII